MFTRKCKSTCVHVNADLAIGKCLYIKNPSLNIVVMVDLAMTLSNPCGGSINPTKSLSFVEIGLSIS